MGTGEDEAGLRKNQGAALDNQWGTIQSIGFPFSLPSDNLSWDSPACPSEMSTSYSTNKCYTKNEKLGHVLALGDYLCWT